MRKFRGLTKEGKWVYGYYCQLIGGRHFIILDDAEVHYIQWSTVKLSGFVEVLPETVGQFTDCVNIYAADIIKAIDPIALERGDESEYIGVVVWSNRSLAWVLEN